MEKHCTLQALYCKWKNAMSYIKLYLKLEKKKRSIKVEGDGLFCDGKMSPGR